MICICMTHDHQRSTQCPSLLAFAYSSLYPTLTPLFCPQVTFRKTYPFIRTYSCKIDVAGLYEYVFNFANDTVTFNRLFSAFFPLPRSVHVAGIHLSNLMESILPSFFWSQNLCFDSHPSHREIPPNFLLFIYNLIFLIQEFNPFNDLMYGPGFIFLCTEIRFT